jgi:hypothetical protein
VAQGVGPEFKPKYCKKKKKRQASEEERLKEIREVHPKKRPKETWEGRGHKTTEVHASTTRPPGQTSRKVAIEIQP